MDLRRIAARTREAALGSRTGWALTIIVVAAAKLPFTESPVVFSARWIVINFAINVVDVLVLFVAWRLAVRYPIGRGMRAGDFVPHALAALSYAAADVAMHRVIAPALDPGNPYGVWSGMARAVVAVVGYVIASGFIHGVEYARRYRASRSAELRLRVELADVARQRTEAEFRALKAEINPQLLTRELETVSSLLRVNPDEAERTVVRMGQVMRETLSQRWSDDVTLAEELDAQQPYVAILRARLGDGFQLRWDVSQELGESRVPQMALQALVEIAVALGFDDHSDPVIEIRATRLVQLEEGFRIEVRNPHIDTRVSQPTAAATAQLVALRERLTTMYGDDFRIDADVSDARGVVSLDVPRESVAETSPSYQDPTSQRGRGAWAVPLLLAAFFLTILGSGTAANFGAKLRTGELVPFKHALVESFVIAVMMTGVLYTAIRIVRMGAHAPNLRAHLIAAAGFAVVGGFVRPLIFLLVGAPYRMPPLQGNVERAIGGALQYGLFAAIVAAFEYARRYASVEASGVTLRAQLAEAARRRAEAQLRALKLELNPHFLGNALNAVAALIHIDPARAELVVARLDDTLRDAVARVGLQDVTLADEIESLMSFLAIERARFGDRLAVRLDVEEDARRVRVPHMILQPLVENAVKHGIAPRGGSGHIVVAGRRAGDRLELSVRDDGVGIAHTTKREKVSGSGVGLANVRARLEQLYGAEARLDLIAAPDAGTIARLSLPWR